MSAMSIHHRATRDRLGGEQPIKALIVGDFGGQAPAPDTSPKSLFRVDKDNFDEVFRRLKVSIKIPGLEESLSFDDFDQLGPDYLYENLSLFTQFRGLTRRLKSKQHFSAAVQELRSEGIVSPDEAQSEATTVLPSSAKPLLDSILDTTSTAAVSDAFSVENLIREVIAPYVEQKSDPKLEQYLDAVDNAAADVLRTVLHCKPFRQVEANWRALDLLNRRLDTDTACQLYIADVSVSKLDHAVQAYGDCITDSPQYQQWVAEHSVKGGVPFDVVVLADALENDERAIAQFAWLSSLAKLADWPVLAGLNPTSFGIISQDDGGDRLADIGSHDSLQSLRESAKQAAVFLCAPRFLVRIPYGTKTRPVENLKFEEIRDPRQHEDYLWGSAAFLMLWSIVQQREGDSGQAGLGYSLIEGLPIHITMDGHGDEVVTPPAETYVTESALAKLTEAKIVALQPVKNSDSVAISQWVQFN